MTIAPPRLPPGPVKVEDVNRAFADLAKAAEAEAKAVALGEWRLLEVLASEAASAFAFLTTKRVYSVPPAGALTTTNVRLFNSGQTVIRHALGREPRGYVVLGQAQAGSVSQIDVTTLSGDYKRKEYVAFLASASGLYTIAVVG